MIVKIYDAIDGKTIFSVAASLALAKRQTVQIQVHLII